MFLELLLEVAGVVSVISRGMRLFLCSLSHW